MNVKKRMNKKQLKTKIIYIILLYFFYNSPNIILLKDFHKGNIKICLCTMGKEENLYAKEFIEYYIKLGFDHLFIYDNNSPNTEKIIEVLENKYINQVTIYESLKMNITNQPQAFTHCYYNNGNNFDWLLMIDMDEFLYIVDNTLKNYLSRKIFRKCDFIKYYWVLPTDNNLVHYDPRPLFERFKGPFKKSSIYKTMVKGNISNLTYNIHSVKYFLPNKSFCDNEGNYITSKFIPFKNDKDININKAYLLHFRFKSTEEFIKKLKRGYNAGFDEQKKVTISWYFWLNRITLEKINYIHMLI